MSTLNVYGWIRDSVRRAVLLGFSDAVEQVGALEGNQNISPQLLSLLKQNPATSDTPSMSTPSINTAASTATLEVAEAGNSAKPRRRLGRTLDDIRGDSHKS